MINPTGKRFDYFPLTVDYYDDENYQDVFDEFGPIVDVIYIRALCLIYESGYFVKLDSKRFAKKIYRNLKHPDGPSEDKVFEILNRMAEHGLFDKELFEVGVFTSHGVQRRYCLMNGTFIKAIDEYSLLSKAELIELNALESDDENHKRKVNKTKTKLNKTKLNETKRDEIEINIDEDFYENYFEPSKWTKVLIDNGIISDSDLMIPRYNDLFKTAIDSYKVTDMARAYSYLVRFLLHPSYPITDKYAYIRHALINNTDWVSHEDERIAYFEQLSKELEELRKQQEIADEDLENDDLPF